jgi:prolyl oligopeptidase
MSFKLIIWQIIADSSHLEYNPVMHPDPFLWLEEIDSPQALAWAKAQNAISTTQLEAQPMFFETKTRIQAALDSSQKIPMVSADHGWLYNFWRDANHVRGIWRRTSLESYKTDSPEWELLLDIDKLAAAEEKNWVFQKVLREPHNGKRALVFLSDGGTDAAQMREFDLEQKLFVQDGFTLPTAKSWVFWFNQDTLYVGTDFGAGSLNDSGYPRILKCWQRGQPLEDAVTVFEGKTEDVWVFATCQQEAPHHVFIQRGIDFFTNEFFWLHQKQLHKLEKPNSAKASVFHDWVLLELRENWQGFVQGALIAAPLTAAFAGDATWQVLFTPTPNTALLDFDLTQNSLILNVLEDVQNRLYRSHYDGSNWQVAPLPAPDNATLSVWAYNRRTSDDYWLQATGFTLPNTLFLNSQQLKSAPDFFDASQLQVQQHFCTSSDGTPVPYFLIARHNLELNGKNPAIVYGYGGFEVSQLPAYSTGAGIGWLERGGVYAVANIRGGGEYGPRWHRAALRENRQRAFDDFIAVAEDLIAKNITSPRHLGIRGGSNGGLLMGAMYTQRPELFGAICCAVPLLDMQRYHKLLAGASWTAEYGDPDNPDDWAFIEPYSPYQNLSASQNYPSIFLTTSTRDDRVHPGHARKFMAKLLEQGHRALYYENTEGGHAGAANNPQTAYKLALEYAYFWSELQ